MHDTGASRTPEACGGIVPWGKSASALKAHKMPSSAAASVGIAVETGGRGNSENPGNARYSATT
eukprot:scaffold69636_cov30-Phaeocystis_antarctica.AAC.1